MTSSRVARRYARALLELAAEQGQLEPWGAELARLAGVMMAPELALPLSSPELTQQARIEAMAKIAERLNLSFPLRSFAVVLARHGRIAFGDEIEISQGAEIGRPSTLYARVEGTAEAVERIEVGGSAVIVARGEFRL